MRLHGFPVKTCIIQKTLLDTRLISPVFSLANALAAPPPTPRRILSGMMGGAPTPPLPFKSKLFLKLFFCGGAALPGLNRDPSLFLAWSADFFPTPF